MSETKKSHICTFPGCEAKFTRPYRLKNHALKHSGVISPFICQVKDCYKSYTNESHLRRHNQTAHLKTTVKIFRCSHEGCHQLLSGSYSLKRHIQRAHTEKAHTCDVCQKGFKRKNELRTHSYEHTGVAPFPCEHCPLKFTAYFDYKRHQRYHKSYTCKCGDIFYRWTVYLKHQREKHRKEYKCEICNKIFQQNSTYKDHLATHKDEREAFECPYENCGRLYFYKRNLKMHIDVTHLKTKTFKKSPKKPKKTNVTKGAKQKKARKDVGTTKRSTAVQLSGLKVPYEAEKAVVSGLQVRAENSDEFIDSSDFSDSEYRIKKTRII